MALPMFAITLFVSAFLLFLVQPMIGKLILPRLGGTPQVWNTCMVFFQAALLAGYAYTHTVSTRLSLRRQLILHGALLFFPLALLLARAFGTESHNPFSVADFLPPPGANPIPATLFQLTILVGLPFFVVSTSAPLLQKWFANTGHPASKDPYFLYGASNLGSLLALIAYPFVLEPNLLLKSQGVTWAVGYALLLVLVLMCAAMVWQSPPTVRLSIPGDSPRQAPDAPPPPAFEAAGMNPPAPAPTATPQTAIKKAPRSGFHPEPAVSTIERSADEITTGRRLRWIGLAAVPVSLMLGVTTHITTDLSPIPLIWLLTLSLYLLSFILVFSRWPVTWVGAPHTAFLYLHPIAMGLMIFVDATAGHRLGFLVFFLILGFFWTAMVCHGELVRDRPSTRYLTEFYLWMSVGGALGGVFNGLIAPVLFVGVWEFPLAIFAACMLRPRLKDSGWTDDLAGELMYGTAPQPAHPKKGQKYTPRSIVKTEPNLAFHYTLDILLPGVLLIAMLLAAFVLRGPISRMAGNIGLVYFLIFGIPLIICCFYYGRPIRFGLGIGAVLAVLALFQDQDRRALFAGRSYFGIIRVSESAATMPDSKNDLVDDRYTRLMHGTTDHGMNFKKPTGAKSGNPKDDYSRLATTYYHRLGPVGVAMEKFNWFPGPRKYNVESVWGNNVFWSDARMPASLVAASAVMPLGLPLPTDTLVDLWSEPPYATIGLGTGTMASYGRPFQHVHFYEIDNMIRKLSLPVGGLENYFSGRKMPKEGTAYFNYLQECLKRGAQVQVLMGDARLRMAQPYENYYQHTATGGGPNDFYHLMVVDAFSSDAIPVHLITKEALEMYFTKLTKDGVLCVHTSNRHVDLVRVVADVANSITWEEQDGTGEKITKRLVCRRGHDQAPEGVEFEEAGRLGHYTSEWVMVARDEKYLEHLREPPGYVDAMQAAAQNEAGRRRRSLDPDDPYWRTPEVHGKYVWTDNYSNLIAVLRMFLPPGQ